MRRFLLLFLVLLLPACSGSFSKISESEKSIHLRAEIPGMDHIQLLKETRVWMEENFTAVREPVVFQDFQQSTIGGRGHIQYPCAWYNCLTKSGMNVYFLHKVDTVDGAIVSTFRDLVVSETRLGGESDFATGMQAPVWSKRDLDAIRPKLLALHNDLVSFLRKAAR